jgi:phage tail protein X
MNSAMAQQGESLDALAWRIYGQQTSALLPQLIDINPHLLPHAILPQHQVVWLPDQPVERTQRPTLKLWD